MSTPASSRSTAHSGRAPFIGLSRTAVAASLLALGALALAVTGSTGCSGGGSGTISNGSGGAGAASTASLQRFCAAGCAFDARCGRTKADCENGCVAEVQKDLVITKIRESYLSGVTNCLSGLTCTQKDDTCIVNFTYADPAFPNVPVVQACLEKHASCSAGGTSAFSKDYCTTTVTLTDTARAEADLCRSKPCEEVKACLQAAGAWNI